MVKILQIQLTVLITSKLYILSHFDRDTLFSLVPSISSTVQSSLMSTCHLEGTELPNCHLLISQILPPLWVVPIQGAGMV